MFREIVERFRDYFYVWNPVELSDAERNVKKIMPDENDVLNENKEPITTKELREKANDKFGMKKETARRKAYLLKDKGVVRNIRSGEWVSTGRHKKLSKSKLKNLFILIGLFFLVLSFAFHSPWPLLSSLVILIVSIVLFW